MSPEAEKPRDFLLGFLRCGHRHRACRGGRSGVKGHLPKCSIGEDALPGSFSSWRLYLFANGSSLIANWQCALPERSTGFDFEKP